MRTTIPSASYPASTFRRIRAVGNGRAANSWALRIRVRVKKRLANTSPQAVKRQCNTALAGDGLEPIQKSVQLGRDQVGQRGSSHSSGYRDERGYGIFRPRFLSQRDLRIRRAFAVAHDDIFAGIRLHVLAQILARCLGVGFAGCIGRRPSLHRQSVRRTQMFLAFRKTGAMDEVHRPKNPGTIRTRYLVEIVRRSAFPASVSRY